MTMTSQLDDTAVLPFGLPLGRHTTDPAQADTEPIPFRAAPTQELDAHRTQAPPTLKVSETCGPCGSALTLEWVGRTETLRVLREWRESHRCRPSHMPPDAAGSKGSLIQRADEGESAGFLAST